MISCPRAWLYAWKAPAHQDYTGVADVLLYDALLYYKTMAVKFSGIKPITI